RGRGGARRAGYPLRPAPAALHPAPARRTAGAPLSERRVQSPSAGRSPVLRDRGDYRSPSPTPSRARGGDGAMCGIVGIVHRDAARPVDPEVVRTMCAAIRHRGPDDEGVYASGPVGLGMRRLSIIDLAGGKQPIANDDGTPVIG